MEKRGLSAALKEAGVRRGLRWAVADAMRLGLHGQVRRCWAPRGVKVRQRRQVRYVWRYPALAVDGLRGDLRWEWLANVKAASIAGAVRAFQAAGVEALVWDGSGGHKGKAVRETGMRLVTLPPYSPELSPGERVFEAVRAAVEGRVYGKDVEEKVAKAEAYLRELAADPEAVKRMCGWEWLRTEAEALPPHSGPL